MVGLRVLVQTRPEVDHLGSPWDEVWCYDLCGGRGEAQQERWPLERPAPTHNRRPAAREELWVFITGLGMPETWDPQMLHLEIPQILWIWE